MEIGPLALQDVLSVGPHHTIIEVARMMVERQVGAAVVNTEDGRPGIITERDLLRAMAEGSDAQDTPVERYMTAGAMTASPNWDVTDAARRMIDGGFRHLIVLDDRGQVAGILSIRDLVKALLNP